MNCVELQQSLAEVEDGSTPEQNLHLTQCAECAALLEDLNLIVAKAGELQACDEPSPRVWNSIEIALRNEGLIRPQGRPAPGSFAARWGIARWLVPAAAMILIALGIYERRQWAPAGQEALVSTPAVNPVSMNQPLLNQALLNQASMNQGLNDEDLIQEVADNPPAMRSQYQENLQRVNESIRDAEAAVKESPNDPDARRSLMDAYQQKSMLFEMAMDRPQQ
jgi:hypothetical protein